MTAAPREGPSKDPGRAHVWLFVALLAILLVIDIALAAADLLVD